MEVGAERPANLVAGAAEPAMTKCLQKVVLGVDLVRVKHRSLYATVDMLRRPMACKHKVVTQEGVPVQ